MPIVFRIFILILLITLQTDIFSWGKTGHRVTAEYAESILSKKAKKRIKKILKNKSLAQVSNFSDEIKSDNRYRKFSQWHYINVEDDENIDSLIHKNINIISAIDSCIIVLKSNKSSDDEKEFYLKMLIHLIGDFHQPLHMARYSDKGGNNIPVIWFGDTINLHQLWDENMLDFYQMSYFELYEEIKIIEPEKRKLYFDGNIYSWMHDTRSIVDSVYNSAEKYSLLGYQYHYQYFPLVKMQLQKAGIRLAKILEEIY